MRDELQRDIEAYIEDHWSEVVDDIDSLVSIESVEDLDAASEGAPFGPGPREALDRALSISRRMGFEAHDCEGYMGFADFKGAAETQIGIIGHVDVVPAGSGWSVDPFRVTRKDGYLVGRGVIDDKGPLMVALHAMKFWADRGEQLPYTVRILFGANEETNMKDVGYYRARYADPAFLFTPDNQFPVGYGESGICSGPLESRVFESGKIVELAGGSAVNAVPSQAYAVVRDTDLEAGEYGRVMVESFGDGAFRIEAQGVAAHASTPELGVNAIGLLVDFLLEHSAGSAEELEFLGVLKRLHDDPNGSGVGVSCSDEHFGNLTAVGGVIDLVDGRIRQLIDFRYPTTTTSSDIERAVREVAGGVQGTFAMEHDKEPFLVDPDSSTVRALLEAYNDATGENRSAITSKGGTYARTFSVGVSFGVEKPWVENPAWVGGMHGPDEGVSEDLLKESFAIYVRTLGNLMKLDLADA